MKGYRRRELRLEGWEGHRRQSIPVELERRVNEGPGEAVRCISPFTAELRECKRLPSLIFQFSCLGDDPAV